MPTSDALWSLIERYRGRMAESDLPQIYGTLTGHRSSASLARGTTMSQEKTASKVHDRRSDQALEPKSVPYTGPERRKSPRQEFNGDDPRG